MVPDVSIIRGGRRQPTVVLHVGVGGNQPPSASHLDRRRSFPAVGTAGARVCYVQRKLQEVAGIGHYQLRLTRVYRTQPSVQAPENRSVHRPSLAGLETVSALGG